ncbi:hypothetical protein PIGHUM_02783 [Pigmentiphaga humi]|uniref:Uncharacterized protein n=1 Tax=Pigmentiphaga humi TaxID=2478468 RepID=A0A3P4B337_9BURK|nr:hypothetical protein PIGHUM_02783 [Pigmentiphaga humi]
MTPPYALTRAPQGAKRVDRQSRIHRFLGLQEVFGFAALSASHRDSCEAGGVPGGVG